MYPTPPPIADILEACGSENKSGLPNFDIRTRGKANARFKP